MKSRFISMYFLILISFTSILSTFFVVFSGEANKIIPVQSTVKNVSFSAVVNSPCWPVPRLYKN